MLHLPWFSLQKSKVVEQNCREEDGLVSKVHRLVIPTSQRVEYLRDLHSRHLEEERNLLQGALKIVFWPGILDDIRNAVKACNILLARNTSQFNRRSPSCGMIHPACYG